ncbi:MAG: OB-fold nucleic acid binding domain-containing protein [Candidatus Woesearchaeota archaeon]
MQENFKRQIAYKIKISDLIRGDYVKREGWEPNYIKDSFGREISRVNISGVILSKSEEINFKSITIDDGTGIINIRTFGDYDFSNFDVGDIVCVIGKPRAFGNEKYVVMEIIKKVDDKEFLKARDLEVEYQKRKLSLQQEHRIGKTDAIYNLIKELDDGFGVEISEIIKRAAIPDAEKIIKKMLESGDIFEIKPGRVKTLE